MNENTLIHVRASGRTIEARLAELLGQGETISAVPRGDGDLIAWVLNRLDAGISVSGLVLSRQGDNIIIMPVPSYG